MTTCDVELLVDIPAGCPDGHSILFRGAGDEVGGREQDLQVVVKVAAHAVFTCKDADLFMVLSVPLVEALCGFEGTVVGIDGEVMGIGKQDVRPGDRVVIRRAGMPVVGAGRTGEAGEEKGKKKERARGDLTVVFKILFPPPLTEAQRSQVMLAFT